MKILLLISVFSLSCQVSEKCHKEGQNVLRKVCVAKKTGMVRGCKAYEEHIFICDRGKWLKHEERGE